MIKAIKFAVKDYSENDRKLLTIEALLLDGRTREDALSDEFKLRQLWERVRYERDTMLLQ